MNREILDALIDFAEENWSAFSNRFEERVGEELTDELFDEFKESTEITK